MPRKAASLAELTKLQPTNTDIDAIRSLRGRLVAANAGWFANDNIQAHMIDGDKEAIQREVERRVAYLLDALVIDTKNDHNTKATSERVARMLVQETFSGRYLPAPATTVFPNVRKHSQLYTVGPLPVRSTCSHHLQPVYGRAWVGIMADAEVTGLSKFPRIVEWFASRPSIQEELVEQIADYLQSEFKPTAVAVTIKAEHFCMKMRGVKTEEATMVNTTLRGLLMDDAPLRAEYYTMLAAQGFRSDL